MSYPNSNYYPQNPQNNMNAAPYPNYPNYAPFDQSSQKLEPLSPEVFGEEPMQVHCHKCNHNGLTQIKLKPYCGTYLLCLCLLCIPFYVKGLNDIEHHCSNCGEIVGKVDRCENCCDNCGNGKCCEICLERCCHKCLRGY